MKTFKITAAQGEVNLRRIEKLPEGAAPIAADKGKLIVGHSESGNVHYIPEGDGVMVMERVKDVPAGMQIFYAILETPSMLIQDAASPHEGIALDAGIFEIRISREFDPFAEQVRRVAD